MNELTIGRNLGAMFESAARHLTFDAAKSTLPPSVTSFINTNYYNTGTEFSTESIIQALESNNESEAYVVLKHVVGRMGISSEDNFEIKLLYPHIIKQVGSNNWKIKRLVYAVILRFNERFEDITLLSINAIQKSLTDSNAIIRSMAIRCLSGIKIQAILPILVLSIGKMVRDSSPLVRSACAIAIVKCNELDDGRNSDVSSQLDGYLDTLLDDKDVKVLGDALLCYKEIHYGNFDMIHNKINHLIDSIEDLEGFAVVELIDLLVDYVRLFFNEFDGLKNAPVELKWLFEKLTLRLEFEMDSNVVLSIVRCLVELFRNDCDIVRPLLKITMKNAVNDNSGEILLCLKYIEFLIQDGVIELNGDDIHHFIPSLIDNCEIFQIKSKIMFTLFDEINFNINFRHLIEILNSKFNWICKKNIIKGLNLLINNDNERLNDKQIKIILKFYMKKLNDENNEILMSEYISGLRELIQSNIDKYGSILIKLSNEIDNYSSNARASIISILGDFVIRENENNESEELIILRKVLPDLCRKLVKNFKIEGYHVKLGILIFLSKLLTKDILNKRDLNNGNYELNDNKLFKMFNYVLMMTKIDDDVDIRDISRFIGGLLPNIVYLGKNDTKFTESWEVNEILQFTINECIERCERIDVAVLLLQLDKTTTVNNTITTGTSWTCPIKPAGPGRFIDYYDELRRRDDAEVVTATQIRDDDIGQTFTHAQVTRGRQTVDVSVQSLDDFLNS